MLWPTSEVFGGFGSLGVFLFLHKTMFFIPGGLLKIARQFIAGFLIRNSFLVRRDGCAVSAVSPEACQLFPDYSP